MPIKYDESGKRWIDVETLVPGTPHQVWEAIATGSGMAAWFLRSEIEPRVGGAFRILFGNDESTSGEVTTWEPPSQFGYVERDWAPGAPPLFTEITITGRSDGHCVLRMDHALFASSDEWDDQMERFENGWSGFLAILRVYLQHFAGTDAASFVAMTTTNEEEHSTWTGLTDALGVVRVNVGERCTASTGPEPWSGVVDYVHQDRKGRYLLLRLDVPSQGIALVGISDDPAAGGGAGTNVSVCRYFYGDDAPSSAACRSRMARLVSQDVRNARRHRRLNLSFLGIDPLRQSIQKADESSNKIRMLGRTEMIRAWNDGQLQV